MQRQGNHCEPSDPAAADWLVVLRRYVLFIAPANLLWESSHLPLYTIWTDASAREMAFAVVHCTGGDVLIATASLILALLVAANRSWPLGAPSYRRVALVAVALGVGYTIFSEWLNVVVRRSWAYSPLMPVIPFLDAGLSPVMQWIAVPIAGFWFARRNIVLRSSGR